MNLKLIFLALLFTLQVFSQVQQEWVRIYNGTGNGEDRAYQVALDKGGSIYVAGRMWQGNVNGFDFATIKYNTQGDLIWIRTFNYSGNSSDDARYIFVDSAGNIYTAGWGYSFNGYFDYLIVKYNTNGTLLWSANYNGGYDDVLIGIDVDIYGNVYVTGESQTFITGKDIVTVKFNSSGQQQWVRSYNGYSTNNDRGNGIKVSPEGYVYVTGGSEGDSTDWDYITVKYDTSGNQIWARRHNGSGNFIDEAYGILVTGFAGIVITGKSWFGNNLGFGSLTISYGSDGSFNWSNSYNGDLGEKDATHFITADNNNNVIITGWSWQSGRTIDYTTIKYTSVGFQNWVRFYDSPNHWWDLAADIKTDKHNNIYVTGGSEFDGKASEDFATVKYSPQGNELWAIRYDGPDSFGDVANSIAIDTNGNVYVTGWSRRINSGYDFCTIKYSQPIGIQPISTEIPNKFSLSQNYPNPFNPVTHFEFRIANFGFVKLSVFDALGREVETLINEQLKPGVYEVEFDGTELPSGVYFYKLFTNGFSETKKMVLLK